MGRRGGSIYISTDPNNLSPIGTPGAGLSIGPMGTLIYNPEVFVPPDGGTQNIVYEGALTNAVVNPATPLAALTLTFDNGQHDGDQLRIAFTKAITTLTFSGANINTVPALPTSAAAGDLIAFVWTMPGANWVRFL